MATIVLNRGPKDLWELLNPILKEGELGVILNSSFGEYKIGDGKTKWNNLPMLYGKDPYKLDKSLYDLDKESFITKDTTSLKNYYLKTDTYNQKEINDRLGAITTINFKIVETKPEVGELNIIYLIKNPKTGEDSYDEYIYIDNKWEIIGSTSIDLSQYYTKEDANKIFANKTELNNKQDSLTETQQNAVNSGITLEKVSIYDGYQAQIDDKQPAGDYILDAPSDNKTYGRNNGKWVENTATPDEIDVNDTGVKPVDENIKMYVSLNEENPAVDMIVPEAPANGKSYVRKDNAWYESQSKEEVKVVDELPSPSLDAPTVVYLKGAKSNNSAYTRQETDGKIQEAFTLPEDTKTYGRKGNEWVEVFVPKGEIANISLTSNQDDKSDLLGAVITFRKNGKLYKTFNWEGSPIIVPKILDSYSIEVSNIEGYKSPVSQEYTYIEDNIRNISFEYLTEIASLTVSRRDGGSTANCEVKINGKTRTIGESGVLKEKIPFDTEYTVEAVTEYPMSIKPEPVSFTANQKSRDIQLSYGKISVSTVTFTSVSDPKNITSNPEEDALGILLPKFRRCLCKNTGEGEVVICYLNDTNSNQYYDESPAVLTGDEGDVMVYFPEFFYKHEKLDGGNFAYHISDKNADGTYIHVPASLVGAYKAFVTGNKVYSRSGVTPTREITNPNYSAYAKARGEGYDIIDYNQHCTIALMLYAKYKNRNLQAVLGAGGASSSTPTGSTNSKGNADTVNGTSGYVNGLGIEGVFGGCYEWVSGVEINNHVWTIHNPEGDTRTVNAGKSSGWIIKVQAEVGPYFDMVPTDVLGGSETTYYADYYYQGSGSRVLACSFSNSDASGGVACALATLDSTLADTGIGSRLAFRGVIREAESVEAFKAL